MQMSARGTSSFCVHRQEFELAVHIKDVGCQHAVLQHCREAPNFSAESMLKLAYFSKAALNSNPDVTRLALQAAIQLLLSKGHAVPHDQVAQVIMHDTLLMYQGATCKIRMRHMTYDASCWQDD